MGEPRTREAYAKKISSVFSARLPKPGEMAQVVSRTYRPKSKRIWQAARVEGIDILRDVTEGECYLSKRMSVYTDGAEEAMLARTTEEDLLPYPLKIATVDGKKSKLTASQMAQLRSMDCGPLSQLRFEVEHDNAIRETLIRRRNEMPPFTMPERKLKYWSDTFAQVTKMRMSSWSYTLMPKPNPDAAPAAMLLTMPPGCGKTIVASVFGIHRIAGGVLGGFAKAKAAFGEWAHSARQVHGMVPAANLDGIQLYPVFMWIAPPTTFTQVRRTVGNLVPVLEKHYGHKFRVIPGGDDKMVRTKGEGFDSLDPSVPTIIVGGPTMLADFMKNHQRMAVSVIAIDEPGEDAGGSVHQNMPLAHRVLFVTAQASKLMDRASTARKANFARDVFAPGGYCQVSDS